MKTEFLRRHEIFHGSTKRYYDVPFFWHTMLFAESIEVFEDDAVERSEKARSGDRGRCSERACERGTHKQKSASERGGHGQLVQSSVENFCKRVDGERSEINQVITYSGVFD